MKSSHGYAAIGALLCLGASVAYLVIENPLFGLPDSTWAKIAFFPGAWVGKHAWDWFRPPQTVCVLLGVLTMALTGALAGLALHWLTHPHHDPVR